LTTWTSGATVRTAAWRTGDVERGAEARFRTGWLPGAARFQKPRRHRRAARPRRRDRRGVRPTRVEGDLLHDRPGQAHRPLFPGQRRQGALLLRGRSIRRARRAASGQGTLDQQDRPRAARPRPGVRPFFARPASCTARGRRWIAKAADLAVHVHLQAARHRRRSALAPGCDVLRDRPDHRDHVLVRAGRRRPVERLPVGRTGRTAEPAARALRSRRGRHPHGNARSGALADRCDGGYLWKCRRARSCCCTAGCRTTARRTARRHRDTPTRCTSPTAPRHMQRTTGCNAGRRCLRAGSSRASRPGRGARKPRVPD